MTQYQTIEIINNSGVATIWMNRPEVFNAFDEKLIEEMQDALDLLNQDKSVRVVVLAGRGKHFSAGADLNWMRRQATADNETNLTDARVFAKMLNTLATLNKPTIARVQGLALGGGAGLVAACDIAIADDSAQFATSEVKFGIIPSVISPYVIRAIGERQASRYFLTAERFSAEQALTIGLVHDICPKSQLEEKVSFVANTLLENSPKAQAAAKDLIRYVGQHQINADLLEETAIRISNIRATDEAREGISAFLDKKTPPWKIINI